jgi:hypothetical protein
MNLARYWAVVLQVALLLEIYTMVSASCKSLLSSMHVDFEWIGLSV